MAEVKDIIVRIKVEGDTQYLNALARFEAANARRVKAEAAVAKAINDTARAQRSASSSNYQDVLAKQQNESATQKNRQATVQLGQQIQDFAIQIQSGTNPLIAFSQQMTQAAYVAQGMGGVLGTVARFFVGPWGTAIILATSVLTPLITSLFKTGDEAKKTASETDKLKDATEKYTVVSKAEELASKSLVEVTDELNRLSGRYTLSIEQQAEATKQAARQKLLDAQATYIQVEALAELNEERAKQLELQSPGKITSVGSAASAALKGLGGAEDAAAVSGQILAQRNAEARAKALRDQVTEIERKIKEAADALNYLELHGTEDARNRAAAEAKRLQEQAEALRKRNEEEARRNLERKTEGKEAKDFTPDFEKASGILEEYQQKADIATKETTDLQKEYNRLVQFMSTVAATPYLDLIKKRLEEIDEKLDPTLEKAIKARDAYQAQGGNPEVTQKQDRIKELQGMKALGLYGDAAKRADDEIKNLQIDIDKLNMTTAESKGLEIGIAAINKLTDGLDAAIQGTESFGKAFEDMAKLVVGEITKLVVKFALLQAFKFFFPGSSITGGLEKALGFASAKGNVFQSGSLITAYANGGVVNRPTIFPMANGLGLMGEAGPEAVMPLTRGPDGKLGVQSTGSNVIVNNYGNDKVTVDQRDDATIITIAAERARALVAADVRRGDGSVSTALQGTYRLSRNNR